MRNRMLIVAMALCMAASGAAMAETTDTGADDPAKLGSQVVTLEANPTTGYAWAFTVEGTAVTLEDLGIGEPTSDALGAPSAQSFDVKAVGPGQAAITFTYARSGDAEDGRQVVMTAAVDADGNLELTEVTDTRVMLAEGLGTDTVTVTLQSNPSTGFTWKVAQEGPVLVEDLGYQPDEAEEDRVGVGGVETYAVTGTGAGDATVTFTYVQPWEEDDPPVNTIQLRLTVDGTGNLTRTE